MKFNHKDIEVKSSASILDALSLINSSSSQIALVVDQENKLIGTLTDGDIRRGLLNGETLQAPIERLMNREFRFARIGQDQALVLEMMRQESLYQIPILDTEDHVVDILLLQDILAPEKKPNKVIIMAGGKGIRLRPYTETCPKPMLPIGGKPILEILLKQCKASGFSNFLFSVNYLKEHIIDYFQDGSKWGVSIDYLVEDKPLGTAGSLKLISDTTKDPFLVLNGDVLTHFNLNQLLSFHKQNKADSTMSVRENITTVPFGVVKTNGVDLISFEEKPSYKQLVNAGVYVVEPSLLKLIAPNESIDMPSFLQRIQQYGHRVVVCPIHEYWIDIGRPETLQEAYATWNR